MITINSRRALKRVIIAFFMGFLMFVLLLLTVRLENPSGCIAGYILGFLAVALHFFQVTYFARLENTRFFSFYGLATIARMSIILGFFVGLILMEKIGQFSFTVSFLISYIYHSVIDIYLIKDD